jgi:hypothetical protein
LNNEHQDHVTTELKAIRAELNKILYGNGRAGLHRIGDDLYGPTDGSRPGIARRVAGLEESVKLLAEQRRETQWLLRGVSLGMSFVLLDHVAGGRLMRLLTSIFGGA